MHVPADACAWSASLLRGLVAELTCRGGQVPAIVETESEAGGLDLMLTAIIASAGAAFCMCVGVVVYLRRSGLPVKGKFTEVTISEYSGSNSLFRRSSVDESALGNIAGRKISMQAVDSTRVQESHPGGNFLAKFQVSGDVVHADGRTGGPATGDSSDFTGQDSSEIEERLFEADMEEEEPAMRPISKTYTAELLAGSVGRFGSGMKPKLPVFRPAVTETSASLVWNAPGPSGKKAPISLTSDLIVLSPHGEDPDEVVLEESEPDMPQAAQTSASRAKRFEGKVGNLQVALQNGDRERSDQGNASPQKEGGDDPNAVQEGTQIDAKVEAGDEHEEAVTPEAADDKSTRKRSFFSAHPSLLQRPSIFQRKRTIRQDKPSEAQNVEAAPAGVQAYALGTKAPEHESVPMPDQLGEHRSTEAEVEEDRGSKALASDGDRVSAELVVLSSTYDSANNGVETMESETKTAEQDLALPSLAGKMEDSFEEEAEPGDPATLNLSHASAQHDDACLHSA